MNTTVKNKKKKILIIGADGYIGTALSSYLKRKKLNITTLDTGYFREWLYVRSQEIRFKYRHS